MATFTKYNAQWHEGQSDLQIELDCISKGGSWTGKSGNKCGLGMFEHLMAARKLVWPSRYRHKWTDLLYQNFIENDITIMMGAASTQKTSHASEFILLNYWARPHNTLAMLTTINVDKLESGVFGEIKMLWQVGRDNYPWLGGNLIDHKHCLATDDIDDGRARDLRRGICGKPCYMGRGVG